jgi:hypothetical protein
MASTLNGLPVVYSGSSSMLKWFTVPGLGRKVLLNRYYGPILVDFIAQWHKRMPSRLKLYHGPLDGWVKPRAARGSSRYSNHSGGTAVDLRYDILKPTGRRYMTNSERYILKQLLAEYKGVLQNGYMWNAVDEMHTEVAPGISLAYAQTVMRSLKIDSNGKRGGVVAPPVLGDRRPVVRLSNVMKAAKLDPPKAEGARGEHPSDTKIVEAALNKAGLLKKSLVNGYWGTATIDAYAAWQRKCGFTGSDASGIPGKTSLKKLGDKYGFRVV